MGLIDKELRNATRFKKSLIGLSNGDCFDKNVSDKLSGLTLKTGNSEVHQCHDIISFNAKNKRTQYAKGQRDRRDRKSERSEKGYWGNKINPIIENNSNSEVNDYHHIYY